MNPRQATLAVLEELRRRRTEGHRAVYLENQTLEALSGVLSENSPERGKSEFSSHDSSREVLSGVEEKLPHLVEEVEEASQIVAFEKVGKVNDFPVSAPIELPQGDKSNQWQWLREKVLSCEICNRELNPQGKVVFGSGNLDAQIFFCGEAPGADEEIMGEPFVGPAGDLLQRIIEAMGLSRESVYLGNILNWRPRHNQSFGNRPPSLAETSFCLPYLKAQVEIVRPRVLVALGKTATDGLLGHDPKRRLSDCRGKWTEALGTPMMVTYHPSYLLHNPSRSSKRKVWEDMLLVMEKLGMEISEKQRSFFS